MRYLVCFKILNTEYYILYTFFTVLTSINSHQVLYHLILNQDDENEVIIR